MDKTKDFPFEITEVDSKVSEEIKQCYEGEKLNTILVGPKGYCLSSPYKPQAADIYHVPLRPSDIFVVTFPRSGTTWTQELVWLLTNDLDYDTALKVPLTERYTFLEMSTLINDESKRMLDQHTPNKQAVRELITPGPEVMAAQPSPRYVKSHLKLMLLPPSLLDTTKVVYVARDPRDAAVSYYHFQKSNKISPYIGDFKLFFNLFTRGLLNWGPIFEHIKEAWERRHHSNMLFLFYEDLYKDLPGTVRRVATFFGKQYSDEQLHQLCQHLHFDNFKNNKAVDLQNMKEIGVFDPKMSFIRKGKSGGWREYFDAELEQQADRWIADNLRGTDLAFPEI